MTRQFTNGELRTFKECRRKWWLGWYRKFRPAEKSVAGTAAALGTRVHSALSAYYSRDPRNPFVVLENELARDRELVAADPTKLDELEKDGELARIMLEGYVEWLGETGADQGLRIVGDEVKMTVPMPGLEGVELMGKLDLRVER